MASARICALLLAGGEGRRFGGDKLVAPLADGTPLAVAAAMPLLACVERVMAVTRPGREALIRALEAAGCEVVVTDACAEGMGASIAAGVAASPDADGWLILPADMPAVRPSSVAAVVAALARGSLVARPEHKGRGGHPVGFAASLRAELSVLGGDVGARWVVERHRRDLGRVPVDDPGVLLDVDTPADLERLAGGGKQGE